VAEGFLKTKKGNSNTPSIRAGNGRTVGAVRAKPDCFERRGAGEGNRKKAAGQMLRSREGGEGWNLICREDLAAIYLKREVPKVYSPKEEDMKENREFGEPFLDQWNLLLN